jgi:ketosteroid isomerase-like protein
MSTETTRAVLDHHMAAMDAADVDGVLADYADDCIFISGDNILRGRDAVRNVFARVPAGMASQMNMQHSVCDGDIAYIVWTMPNGAKGTDTFVLRDGKIVVQTVANFLV